MDVNGEWQLGSFTGTLDHATYAHSTEWLTTFVDEHVGRRASALQALETGKLVPFEVVAAIGRALEAAHDDGALRQIDVAPPQIAGLADA